MKTEKIEVVCDGNCDCCKIRQEYDGYYSCISLSEEIPIINIGDTIKIEIIRK